MASLRGDHNPLVNFGRFEMRGRLGEGAAGAVYRAFDPELGREVALKLLHKVDELKGKRFEREAEVTASLSHPGILRVHNFGVSEGVPYLVYELVEGARTLEEALAGLAPGDLEARLALVRQATLAIGYAHERGVVHRDLKPSNLLVDREGRLRVADFGVATGQDLERLTMTGVWVGTPLYMAPEQLYCERDRFGPHTDVWALGAILFEALTGQLPFEATTPMELLSVAREGARSPRSLVPELPQALEQICLRALEVEPEARYANGGELAQALTRYLEDGTGEARSSRWRSGVCLGALVAFGLVGLLGLRGIAASHPPSPSSTPSPGVSVRSSSAAPRAPEISADRALDQALSLRGGAERLRAVSDWCLANPNHGKLRRAQRARDQLCWDHPIFDRDVTEPGLGSLKGDLAGSDFVSFQAASSSKPAGKVMRWNIEASSAQELPVRFPLGLCSLGQGVALLAQRKGLLVSEKGGPLSPLEPELNWPRGEEVFLASQPAERGGHWILLASERSQLVVRVSGGRLLERQELRGWPKDTQLRGAILTPTRQAILFGLAVKSGLDSGLAIRFDARSGRVQEHLLREQELNALFSATYDPKDPSRIVIGTRFGKVLLLSGGEKQALVSAGATRFGIGERAHACAIRFVGFWRGERILTIASDPNVAGVLNIWRASDRAHLQSVKLGLTFKVAVADDRHLLLLGSKRARIYRLN